METLLLAACVLLLDAAWIGGLGAVLSLPYGPGSPAVLSVGWALATLVAGAGAGHALVRGRPGGTAPAPPRARAVRAGLVLLLGCVWSLILVAGTRHGPGGDAVAWVLDLPAAAARPWRATSPDALATGLLLFAWWRGQRTGARSPDFAAVVRAMGLGSLLLAGGLLLAAMTLGAPAAGGPAALLLLGAGLPALALARLREVRRDAAAAGGEAPSGVERTWLLATAVPVAAVLGVALAAALALGDESVRRALTDAVRLGAALLWGLLYWPLLAAGFLVELLFAAVQLLVPQVTLPRLLPDLPVPGDGLPPPAGGAGGPAPWPGALRWALAGVVLMGVTAAFLLTARRSGDAAPPLPRAVAGRESLWSWSDLPRAWRRWLAGLRRRWPAAPVADGAAAARVVLPEGPQGTRALYRRFLALGRASGLPRGAPQTPREYLGAWRDVLPGEDEAGALTGAYERARYGRPGAPAAGPAELQPRLDRLRRLVARRPSSGTSLGRPPSDR